MSPATKFWVGEEEQVLRVNVAVTLLAWVMETVQVPVPEQPEPDQPVKVEPPAAAAVKVTEVPEV